jgi:nuclear transport factor 2 (NTF2) superfamily protein
MPPEVSTMVTEEDLKTWLEIYGRAWENRDPQSVTGLFTEDATYQETPFSEPMRGRAAIGEYWLKVVVQAQKRIRFRSEILAIHGNLAFAHWWSSFTRISTGRPVRLNGIFVLNFSDPIHCGKLREWWMRQDGAAP